MPASVDLATSATPDIAGPWLRSRRCPALLCGYSPPPQEPPESDDDELLLLHDPPEELDWSDVVTVVHREALPLSG